MDNRLGDRTSPISNSAMCDEVLRGPTPTSDLSPDRVATVQRRRTVLIAESTSNDVLRKERGTEAAEENASLERLVQHLSATRVQVVPLA